MKTSETSRIVVSAGFAIAIIVSAFALRASPAGAWVETALTGCALAFAVLRRPASTR